MSDIRIVDLVKAYDGTVAVDGISLDVRAGEIVGLLGHSGCGKTTTLKCLAGLEEPSGGEIWIGDRLVGSARKSVPPERRNIGMVFQTYALWPHKTVYANVAYPLEVRRRPRQETRRRVAEALEVVGLGEYAHRYPSQLSGGQQQRVALARSIVYEPEVLLFDEPLSNLDANTRLRVRGDLKRLLTRLRTTSVYVTHDQTEAMAICDRVALMHQGRIVQIGTPDELYATPAEVVVAELIGAGNILDGRVVETSSGGLVADLGGLRLNCNGGARGSGVGDAVKVVLRRERLRLHHAPVDGANCWPVRVQQRISFGAYQECVVSAGDRELTVHTDDAAWEAGSDGYVTIPPGDVICFAASTRSAG